MIELNAIKKRFGETDVLKGVTLHVKKGELLSLVGTSGCGKTTTLNVIAGLCQPDEGTVRINQRLVEGRSGGQMELLSNIPTASWLSVTHQFDKFVSLTVRATHVSNFIAEALNPLTRLKPD